MRSRLSLYMNDLSLEELLYLDEELDRHKEKYRKSYTILSVQSSEPVLKTNSASVLAKLSNEMRRFSGECAAVGGGTIIGYSPELTIMLFNEVEHAHATCNALFAGLAEFNGRGGDTSFQVNFKMGMATGQDTLAPGAPRSVRTSKLVKRANQCAYRSAPGVLILDEPTYQKWPAKVSAMRMAFDIDGLHSYRVTAAEAIDETERFDNTGFFAFLELLRKIGVSMIKYDLVHKDKLTAGGAGTTTELLLQAYNPATNRNQTYSETVATPSFEERMESMKRKISSMGMALVRQDLFASL